MRYRSAFIGLLLCLLNTDVLFAQQIVSKQLDALKAKDNLEEWLYTRMDYNAADPQHRLPFLMDTKQQAWRQPKTPAEQLAWLTLLSNQGYYQLLDGNILSSINCYEDAYSWFYKYRLTDFDLPEYVLKPLSNNYTRLGDYERAIYIQQKTIDRLNPVIDADNMASVYCNMAIACYNKGDFPAARAAIARGQQLVKSALVKLRLQNILADIFYEQGDLQNSTALLQGNLAAFKATDAETAFALSGTCTTLGKIAFKTNKPAKASQLFKRALQLLDSYYPGSRLRERANLISQLGKAERLQHHLPQASILLNRALQLLRVNSISNKTIAANIYGENELVDIFHEKALIYLQLKQDVLALQNLRYALLATDRIRREFADSKTRERLQHDGKELAEEAIAVAYRLYQQTHNHNYAGLVLEIAELTKARTLADELQQNTRQLIGTGRYTVMHRKLDIERAIAYNEKMAMTERKPESYRKKIEGLKFDLALLNKRHHIPTDAPLLNTKQIMAAIPDSVHFIEYFFGKNAVYGIDINNQRINTITQIANPVNLQGLIEELMDKYYRNGPDRMLNEPEQFCHLSHTVYTLLFNNIQLRPGEHLCIIPDDALGYLSFDGLITGERYEPAISQWPFLIKQVTTTYAFSINTLIQNKLPDTTGSSFSGLFITHQNSKPIIAVKREAKAIADLVHGNYQYDDEVNSQTFFKAFDNANALHISTHAYLSGPTKEPTLELGQSKLYLFELLAHSHRPQLVVLGACRTGDGLLARGEGIISLARGFSAIGTPSTIAGLWNVNDDAAAKITANLYKNLLAGQTSGTALHNAKLAWLQNNHPSDALYLPYYWDSLILMGANKPVHLQAAKSWFLPLMLFVVVITIIVGYLLLSKKLTRK